MHAMVRLLGLAALSTGLLAGAGTATAHEGEACWPSISAQPGEDQIRKDGPHRVDYVPAPKLPPAGPASRPATSGVPYGAIRRVNLPAGAPNLIALTFDLCEQPYEITGYQGGIVDYLRSQKAKATFFAGGKWMATHQERTHQLMSDPLFEIGNHGWEHRNLRLVDGEDLRREVLAPQFSYRQRFAELQRRAESNAACAPALSRAAKEMTTFRFPFGACNPASLRAVQSAGLRAIQWDVSAGDPWPGQTAKGMIDSVLRQVRRGSIIIFHANGRGWKTEEALRTIIPELKRRGFQMVTVSELLAAGEPEIHSTCWDIKPGDSERYDAVARRLEVQYQEYYRRKGVGAPDLAPPGPPVQIYPPAPPTPAAAPPVEPPAPPAQPRLIQQPKPAPAPRPRQPRDQDQPFDRN